MRDMLGIEVFCLGVSTVPTKELNARILTNLSLHVSKTRC